MGCHAIEKEGWSAKENGGGIPLPNKSAGGGPTKVCARMCLHVYALWPSSPGHRCETASPVYDKGVGWVGRDRYAATRTAHGGGGGMYSRFRLLCRKTPSDASLRAEDGKAQAEHGSLPVAAQRMCTRRRPVSVQLLILDTIEGRLVLRLGSVTQIGRASCRERVSQLV